MTAGVSWNEGIPVERSSAEFAIRATQSSCASAGTGHSACIRCLSFASRERQGFASVARHGLSHDGASGLLSDI